MLVYARELLQCEDHSLAEFLLAFSSCNLLPLEMRMGSYKYQKGKHVSLEAVCCVWRNENR